MIELVVVFQEFCRDIVHLAILFILHNVGQVCSRCGGSVEVKRGCLGCIVKEVWFSCFVCLIILNESSSLCNDGGVNVLPLNVNLGFLAVEGKAIEARSKVESCNIEVVQGNGLD